MERLSGYVIGATPPPRYISQLRRIWVIKLVVQPTDVEVIWEAQVELVRARLVVRASSSRSAVAILRPDGSPVLWK